MVQNMSIPILQTVLADQERGREANARLIFSSISSRSFFSDSLFKAGPKGTTGAGKDMSNARKADGATNGPPRMTVYAGRYGIDTEMVAVPKSAFGDLVDGQLGTGALERTLVHDERYISLDAHSGAWRIGSSPYRSSTVATVFKLDGLLAGDNIAYTVELNLNGDMVRCLFDTTCPYPLVVPDGSDTQPTVFQVGKVRLSVSPVSMNRLPAGTIAQDKPHVGLRLFHKARVTLEPGKRLLTVEFPNPPESG
jgi:hypothetical protein